MRTKEHANKADEHDAEPNDGDDEPHCPSQGSATSNRRAVHTGVQRFRRRINVPFEFALAVRTSEFTGGIVIEFNFFLTMRAENLNHGTKIASQGIFLSPTPSKRIRIFMNGMPVHLSTGETMIQTIGVIGAGQMGNGIAQVAACAGYDVVMIDIKDEYVDKGLGTIQFSLGKLVSKERMTQEDADAALARITTGTDRGMCADCDLVVEAVPEILSLKQDIFTELDSLCKPETILASNTSSISITTIAASTQRPEKVIGMHFMNPVPIMKLVEIINGEDTSDDTNSAVVEAAEKMGKTALSCNDAPGFVSNRILCPMINEAILTLQEGVAEPEAIDGIMKLGMNHPIGPLALSDLIGNDTVLHIMNVLYEGFGTEKYAPAPMLVQMVEEGKLGRKSGQGFYTY